jgi:hypothetical protein
MRHSYLLATTAISIKDANPEMSQFFDSVANR